MDAPKAQSPSKNIQKSLQQPTSNRFISKKKKKSVQLDLFNFTTDYTPTAINFNGALR